MTKSEFLQSVVEFAVANLSQNDLEEWLCEHGHNRLEEGQQLYPDTKDWTPDVLAEAIKEDLPNYMTGVWEHLFE